MCELIAIHQICLPSALAHCKMIAPGNDWSQACQQCDLDKNISSYFRTLLICDSKSFHSINLILLGVRVILMERWNAGNFHWNYFIELCAKRIDTNTLNFINFKRIELLVLFQFISKYTHTQHIHVIIYQVWIAIIFWHIIGVWSFIYTLRWNLLSDNLLRLERRRISI